VSETPEIRFKRLRMRSWHRGTKEMDLILGPFADTDLAGLGPDDLDAYESMLEENDQDLYQWVSGQRPAPEFHCRMIDLLRARHGIG
jgi:antitoxin CptB